MDTEARADDLEERGFNYLKQGQWSEARSCFERMLSLPIAPLRRVKVLKNIMLSYEKDGMREKAVAIGEEAFRLIETNRLSETMEGARLRGYINGRIARLSGASKWLGTIPILS